MGCKYRRCHGGVFTAQVGNISLLYVRDNVGMELLSSGEADIAFLGDDKLGEWQADGRVSDASVVDSVPQDCRFVLAGPRSAVRAIPTQLGTGDLLTVATGYPKLLEAFARERGLNLATTYMPEGGCEGFAASGKTDLVFDIAQSGDTLRDNDLLIYREGDKLSLEVLDGVSYAEASPQDQLEAGLEQIAKAYFERVRQARQPAAPDDSYTVGLLRDPNKLTKKIGEEFGEFLQELFAARPDRARLIGEAADLKYAVDLALAIRGVDPVEVVREDIRRNQITTEPKPEAPETVPPVVTPPLPRPTDPPAPVVFWDDDEGDDFGGGFAH